MANVLIAPQAKQQFNQNGTPVAGGLLFTYISGTTTKQSTYKDFTGATQNTNPVTLDTNGQCDLWLISGSTYTFVLSPSTDSDPPTNPFWTENGITGIANSVTGSSGGVATGTLTQTGDVKFFSGAGSNLATGWLLCTGAAVSRTTYATLYGAIGTTWGIGDGSTTFNLPDLRGRVPAGADNMGGTAASRITFASIGTPAVLGVGAGSELAQTDTITMTVNDPSHLHEISGTTQNLVTFPGTGGNANIVSGTQVSSGSIVTATTGITVTATSGLTGTQQNIQPTLFGNWAIWSGPPLLNQAGGTVTSIVTATGLLPTTITTAGTIVVAPATTTSLGGIVVGPGLTVNAGGTVAVVGGGSGSVSITGGAGITLTPTTITSAGSVNLAPATTTTLGGIIPGANLSITLSGVLSAVTGTGSGGGTVTTVATDASLTGGPITSLGTLGLSVPVTIARGGTAATTATSARVNINIGTVTVTPAGANFTITPTFGSSNVVEATMTSSGTLANPTGLAAGQTDQLIINAGTSGTLTLVYAAAYLFAPPYSNASPPAIGPGYNVLSIVSPDGTLALSVLQAGTFS